MFFIKFNLKCPKIENLINQKLEQNLDIKNVVQQASKNIIENFEDYLKKKVSGLISSDK
jgi:hypothetical protein